MNKVILFSVLISCLIATIFTSPENDRITSLPDLLGTLGVQYSGYVLVNQTKGHYLHYWFVQSAGNPSKDPVVLWLNGGPGCSSLDGFFYEHGPYNFGSGENNISLIDNPYSWNLLANMIYLEAPAHVGFSYSQTPLDFSFNDALVARENFNFLTEWFKLFPQFAGNEFYISGESYAGKYVPTLAQLVLEESNFNFKGVLVGNGVTDPYWDSSALSYYPFLHGHGIIPDETYDALSNDCPTTPQSKSCLAALQKVQANMNNVDIYDIYGNCFHQRPIWAANPHIAQDPPGNVPPCTDAVKATQWLNRNVAKTAIHVKQDIVWSICNEPINIGYDRGDASMMPIYLELLGAKKRALVFSGDTDGAVPYVGSALWTSHLGLNQTSLWRQWFFQDDVYGTQVAGFATEYAEGLTFATVKGAGHMVPQFKPVPAFAMFQRFLSNKPL